MAPNTDPVVADPDTRTTLKRCRDRGINDPAVQFIATTITGAVDRQTILTLRPRALPAERTIYKRRQLNFARHPVAVDNDIFLQSIYKC